MRFWTISYVAIDDFRLAVAYYGGIVLILLYFLWGVIAEHDYLEYDSVQGICRPALEPPKVHGLSSHDSINSRCGPKVKECSDAPLEDVELGVSSGQILIATHVREVLEQCSDTFCRHPQARLQEADFFISDIENYTLAVACNAQSFRFFSEDCHFHENMRQQTPLDAASLRLLRLRGSGVYDEDSFCRYAAANRRLYGRLLGPDGQVIREMPPGTKDSFPVRTWLAAAGISLDDLSDAPDASTADTLRSVGFVLLVTVAYRSASMGSNRLHTMTYDIEVRRIAETGYHISHATVHEDRGTGTSTREHHESNGIFVQFELSGRVGRFSWQALADELVLKFGWLTLLQIALDLFWQYVLPFWGVDYNAKVYRWKVNSRRNLAPKEV